VNEVAVHFSPNQVAAEVAVSALRAHNLHPRLIRDDAMLGVSGGMSVGRFAVLVPEGEAARARAVLHEPVPEDREDNPILRMVIIVAIITGLLVGTPFVAGMCTGTV
jgi:hypothetical protein